MKGGVRQREPASGHAEEQEQLHNFSGAGGV